MNFLLSAAFVLCWSSGFIGAKLGAESAPATTILMWRFLPLVLVLGAAVLLSAARRAEFARLTARDIGRQTVIGLLSQSGYLLTVYWAIQLGVSSGTTALIDGTQPLVAGALAGPLLRQYVSRAQWLGLALGVTGVVIVTLADADAAGGQVAWWAYFVPFAGMFSLVAATFVERRSPREVPPATGLTLQCLTSAVVFTLLAVSTGTHVPPADPSFWTAMSWLVVLATFGGYGLYWLLLRRSGVTEVNTLMFLMAPVTTLWGAAMFDEPFTARTALGLALGLAAVAVVRRGSRRPPARVTSAPSAPPAEVARR